MAKKLLPSIFLFMAFNLCLYAGTGGAEVASWYTDISAALQGSWGKLAAVAFVVLAILALKGGGIVVGAFLFFLGMSVGTIPSIINSKYTMLF